MVLRMTEVQGTEQAGPSLKGEKSTCRCLSYTPGRPGGILCWDSRTAGALPGQQSTPDPSSLGLPPQELPQVEVTKAYFAKQADEITLQQADVVLVLQKEDGEWGTGRCAPEWVQRVLGCSKQPTLSLPRPPKNFLKD